MTELPGGWSALAFSELNAFRPTSIDPANFPDEFFELYSVPAFPTSKPDFVTGARIGSTKQLVSPEDVLICKINPRINRVWLVAERGSERQIASSEWIGFRAPGQCAKFYRYYYASPGFREQLCADLTGVGGSLTRAQPKRVDQLMVPVPPSAEQQRIADKLDAVVARVDACRDRLARVAPLLKRFRQSVLAAATEGRLSPDTSYAVGWQTRPLGDLLVDGPKNGLYKPSSDYGDGIRILRIDSFNDGRVSDWTGLKRLRATNDEMEQFALREGDIVVNRVNSIEHLGKCALVERLDEPCLFESNMMRLRTRDDLRPDFLRVVLCSPAGRAALTSGAKHAVNQASINQGDVKAVPIPLPSIGEQAEIVRRVDTLFAFADHLEARLAKAQAAADRLTPALLAKAFRGELVPQDPADEPAAVLLQRLAASRPVPAAKARRPRAGQGG